jgi:hypothetical protein
MIGEHLRRAIYAYETSKTYETRESLNGFYLCVSAAHATEYKDALKKSGKIGEEFGDLKKRRNIAIYGESV